MFRNFFKIAWRSLFKNKLYSFINIAGLATGMAVALMIGLWIWDELSFDHYHQNFDRIAQVKQNRGSNGSIITQNNIPIPLGNALRTLYKSEFKHVILASNINNHVLSYGDKHLTQSGNFMEPEAPEMFSLKMIAGSSKALNEPGTLILSEAVAKALFGNIDPMSKIIRIDDSLNLKVSGVYESLPANSTLSNISFMASWVSFVSFDKSTKRSLDNWGNNGWQLYAQIADNANMERVSEKINKARLFKSDPENEPYKTRVFLHPMSKWHLYSEFKNGVNTGGKIQYIWMFGIIGVFVLLLACINFMNLSTARSEKRAREVGVRKAVGSLRVQLILQFLIESITVAVLSLIAAQLTVILLLPFFNMLAEKQIKIPYNNIFFWLLLLGFTLFTGFIAGSYPAFYLSGFNIVKVLKGTFRAGPLASVPRKVLVVMQFTVSIVLIIGTIIVFRQIQFSRNRPVGYNREGLISLEMLTPTIHKHFRALRNDLLNSGVVAEAAESSTPTTEIRNEQGNFQWQEMDRNRFYEFATVGISQEFGKTIGWQFTKGRDFSRSIGSDAMGFVINESAQKYMGLKIPIGQIINWTGYKFNIIGVTKDMVMESPYEPVKPTIFFIAPWWIKVVNIRIKPGTGVQDALSKIEPVLKKYSPDETFNFKFADQEFARKFSDEQGIGKLSTVFAFLAILISCLGLFGLASFVAEQRTKEIGVRKVLGASVFNLWKLLSKDFLALVIISLVIASPVAYYFMNRWLQNYQYRSGISWWIFAVAGISAFVITLLTVSYQTIKAALMNPVKSLRTE